MRSEVARAKLALKCTQSSLPIFFICLVVTALGQTDVPSDAPTIHAVRIDGRPVHGRWLGSTDGNSLKVHTEQGLEIIPLDGLLNLTFPEHRASDDGFQGDVPEAGAPEPSTRAAFFLADGGHLTGVILDAPVKSDALVCRTNVGEATIPFDRLAGVQLGSRDASGRAAELFESALAARLPGEDVLVTRGEDEEVKRVHGRLVDLNTRGGTFIYGHRPRTFRTERIYGIVMARGTGAVSRYPLRFELSDGSSLPGLIEYADVASLTLATSIGLTVELPLSQVLRVRVDSDRVVYLSDLSPVSRKNEGIIHRSSRIMMNRCVSGGPLSIGGQIFAKGIGVHSFASLTYDIRGKYETLAATIGIDDSVRPRGNAVFRVVGDGSVLFESGSITGRDRPKDIIVDVSSVEELTLTVDYGDELDIADRADWGGARLLYPAQRPGSDPKTP